MELRKQKANTQQNHSTAESLHRIIEENIKEWEASYLKSDGPEKTRSQASQAQWQKLKANFWKLNSNATWFEKLGRGVELDG